MASSSSGSATQPDPVWVQEVRGGALGRHQRQHRPLGGQVLVDLPRQDRQPAAAGAGDQGAGGRRRPSSPRAPRRAAGSPRPERGRRGCSSSANATSAGRTRPGSGPRPALQRRPDVEQAAQRPEERPRERWPKNEPACSTIRSREDGACTEAGEVVEVARRSAPTRSGVPAAPGPRASSAMNWVTAAPRRPGAGSGGPAAPRPSAWPAPSASRSGGAGSRATSRAGRPPSARRRAERSAAPTRCTEAGGEVVSTTSIPRSSTIRRAGAGGRRHPGDLGIGQQQAAARGSPCAPRPCAARGRRQAGRRRDLLGRAAVRRPVHRRPGRNRRAASSGSWASNSGRRARARPPRTPRPAGAGSSLSTRCTPPPPAGGK